MDVGNDGGQSKKRVGLPAWLARRRPLEPKLMVVDGQATKDEIDIRLPLTIGREQGVGLVITHPLVSRQHCTLTRKDDFLLVKDLSSANGTYINGKKIAEAVLRPGDKLTVGPLTFVAVYQQSGLLSARQMAKKVAQEARKKIAATGGVKPIPRPLDPKAAAKAAAAQTELATAAISGGGGQKTPVAKKGMPPAEVKLGGGGGLAGEPNVLDEDEEGSSNDKIGLFFTWAQQMAASAKRKAKAQAEADAAAAAEASSAADDVSDMLEDDIASRAQTGSSSNDEAAGKTMLAGFAAQQPPSNVAIELTSTIEEPSDSSLNIDMPTIDSQDPRRLETILGFLLGQLDRLQRQMLEHYQEMAITTQLVSKLQQDQFDLIREGMDRMYSLTDVLGQELASKYPDMHIVFDPSNVDAGGDSVTDGPVTLGAGMGSSIMGSAPTNDLGVEAVHGWLMQRMSRIQKSNQHSWAQVRSFLKTHSIKLPSV